MQNVGSAHSFTSDEQMQAWSVNSHLFPPHCHLYRQRHFTCAVASTSIKFIAGTAFTPEQSRDVVAASIDTDVGEGTFIYV